MGQVELRVPDIGDFKEVEVIEVLVKPGDEIGVEQSLITVESDKASMEIPASVGGKLVSLAVKVGDKVSEGSLVGMVEAAGASTGGASASNGSATFSSTGPTTVLPASVAEGVTGSAGENVAKPFETTNPSPEASRGMSAPPVAAHSPVKSFTGTPDLETEMLVLGAGPGG